MTSAYAIRHDGEEFFDLPPHQLWPEIIDVHRFERWWSWLRDAHLDPNEVVTGSMLTFSIVSPLPYRLRCIVDFVTVVPEEKIETLVTGDLKGWAHLDIEADGEGSRVLLSWELEPTQMPMRVLVRAARPLIMRTKDWAIDIALRAFRRNVSKG